MKSNKILNIIIALIAIVGALLFVRIFMSEADLETDVDAQNSVISPLIYYSTILFYAAVVIALGLSLWTIVRNPENLKNPAKPGNPIIQNNLEAFLTV